jgi:hypothetical protein
MNIKNALAAAVVAVIGGYSVISWRNFLSAPFVITFDADDSL